MKNKKNKHGQEEMVGFILIIVIVAVILLIFLGLSIKKPQKQAVESYEVEGFIHGFLQYTTDCRDNSNLEYLPIRKLILACDNSERCLDNRNTCNVLRDTLTEIVKESWRTGQERPVKGYELNITLQNKEFSLKEGNFTGNSKGAVQLLVRNIDVYFTVYY